MHKRGSMQLTDREEEILELVRAGTQSPTELAARLGITQAGASQALQKLARKGKLVRQKQGRTVLYKPPDASRDAELLFVSQAYNALSQVWAYVMTKELPSRELQRAREARDTLEQILARKTS